MAQATFYAARSDEIEVLRFVFDETDCHVYEANSQPDHELRRFASLNDVRDAFDVGSDRPSRTRAIFLDLWSPSTGGGPTVTRYGPTRRSTFHEAIGGWGLFRLQLGGSGDGQVDSSWFSHNSEKRAHRFGDHHYQELAAPDVWDWDAVTKLGRRIIYHVRKRLAVAKVASAVVLAEAEELRRSGWTMR